MIDYKTLSVDELEAEKKKIIKLIDRHETAIKYLSDLFDDIEAVIIDRELID